MLEQGIWGSKGDNKALYKRIGGIGLLSFDNGAPPIGHNYIISMTYSLADTFIRKFESPTYVLAIQKTHTNRLSTYSSLFFVFHSLNTILLKTSNCKIKIEKRRENLNIERKIENIWFLVVNMSYTVCILPNHVKEGCKIPEGDLNS